MSGWLLALAVAVGGGLGAASRHGVDLAVARRGGDEVWGTLLVNVTGSMALGLVVGLAPSQAWIDVVGAGLLGGYTTFSTAMLQAVQRAAEPGRAHVNGGSSVGGVTRAGLLAATMLVSCVAAAAVGVLLGSFVGGGR